MIKTSIHTDSSSFVQVVHDRLRIMRKQECTIYKRNTSLLTPIKLSDCVLDGSWRQRIVEWMYSVVDQCDFSRLSVAVAAHILDISLEKGLVSSRREFQICSMAALLLSVKLNDSRSIRVDSMVKLGQGLFHEKDIVEMELKILLALDWHVHPPTPECFMRQFLQLLPASVPDLVRYMIVEITRFLSEISVCLTKFSKYPPSVIAQAGILIAMDIIDDGLLPPKMRQQIHDVLRNIDGIEYESCEILEAFGELQQSVDGEACLYGLVDSIYSEGMAAGYGLSVITKQEGGTQCRNKYTACSA